MLLSVSVDVDVWGPDDDGAAFGIRFQPIEKQSGHSQEKVSHFLSFSTPHADDLRGVWRRNQYIGTHHFMNFTHKTDFVRTPPFLCHAGCHHAYNTVAITSACKLSYDFSAPDD